MSFDYEVIDTAYGQSVIVSNTGPGSARYTIHLDDGSWIGAGLIGPGSYSTTVVQYATGRVEHVEFEEWVPPVPPRVGLVRVIDEQVHGDDGCWCLEL